MQDVEILTIDLKERSYPVFIGKGGLKNAAELLRPYIRGKAFVVSDENVAPLYLESVARTLNAETVVIPAGESAKCWQTVQAVTDAVLDKGCDRRSALIALGGGVVGDITGFCASILNRGVDFIQIPTTLLAQTDSSVGGKTAIDTRAGKNLIGTFYQPKAVLIDTDTLKTLPCRQILAGYAEVAKYGLIKRADFWEWLEQNGEKVAALDDAAIAYAVKQSILTKARVVIADEREESGERALLNLGHTFGHAFEAASHMAILHGEGVAAGCVYAAKLSEKLGLSALSPQIEAHFRKIGLPVKFDGYPTADLIAWMRKDKKALSGCLNFVLLKDVGQACVVEDVPESAVASVLEE